MNIRSLTVAAIALALTMLSIGCQAPGPVNVPLVFRPTETIGVISGVGLDQPMVVIVQDSRDQKQDIGANVEKAQPLRVYTNDDPAGFVRNVLVEKLHGAGATIVPDSSKAKRTVQLNLTRFWCNEGDTYQTEVTSTAMVLDAGGKQLWKAVVSGSNSRFGRSHSAENYQECFSDATLQMVGNLLTNPEFHAAMK